MVETERLTKPPAVNLPTASNMTRRILLYNMFVRKVFQWGTNKKAIQIESHANGIATDDHS